MSVAPKVAVKQTHISRQMTVIKEHSKEVFELRHHMNISTDDANETLPKAQKRVFFNIAYSSRAL